jgi:hypothetical protein
MKSIDANPKSTARHALTAVASSELSSVTPKMKKMMAMLTVVATFQPLTFHFVEGWVLMGV